MAFISKIILPSIMDILFPIVSLRIPEFIPILGRERKRDEAREVDISKYILLEKFKGIGY